MSVRLTLVDDPGATVVIDDRRGHTRSLLHGGWLALAEHTVHGFERDDRGQLAVWAHLYRSTGEHTYERLRVRDILIVPPARAPFAPARAVEAVPA